MRYLWVSELVYVTSLLTSQGLMSEAPGREMRSGREMRWRMTVPQTWIHRVSNPGPSGLKSSVLPLDQAPRARYLWDCSDQFYLGVVQCICFKMCMWWNICVMCPYTYLLLSSNRSSKSIDLLFYVSTNVKPTAGGKYLSSTVLLCVKCFKAGLFLVQLQLQCLLFYSLLHS